ncbi:MAG TPA: glycine zipper 2TM domain-containing protein [Sphingomicrobium sp.]|nr:glycine zipper 2TM domain-containing protein [Sphingomicrobium sp.]
MLKKSMLAVSALSMLVVPATAEAHHYRGYNGYGQAYDGYGGQGYYGQQAYYGQQGYYAQQGYYPQQAYGYQNAYYGGGYRRHRCSGTTGTIVGAGAGALLGRSIGRGSGYYHRNSGTTGTIIGAALGALVGHEVGKATC